jgi:hypothetical protein
MLQFEHGPASRSISVCVSEAGVREILSDPRGAEFISGSVGQLALMLITNVEEVLFANVSDPPMELVVV